MTSKDNYQIIFLEKLLIQKCKACIIFLNSEPWSQISSGKSSSGSKTSKSSSSDASPPVFVNFSSFFVDFSSFRVVISPTVSVGLFSGSKIEIAVNYQEKNIQYENKTMATKKDRLNSLDPPNKCYLLSNRTVKCSLP